MSKRPKTTSPYRWVKIKAERGYGDNPFVVISERGFGECKEVELAMMLGARTFWIYEAHTYRDAETIRATVAEAQHRIDAAKRIGLKT